MPRLPSINDRIAVLGRTGSGKTVAGLWHLSNMPLDKMPFVIVDFKRDAEIRKLKALEIDDAKQIGKQGLYVFRADPNDDDDLIETMLYDIWRREKCGLFVDEGYLLNKSRAFNAILMQGRSKKIPVITCSQRPVWLPRSVWSESNHFQVFQLVDERDWDTVSNFVRGLPDDPYPPDYHSFYFSLGDKAATMAGPVPPAAQSIAAIREMTGNLKFV